MSYRINTFITSDKVVASYEKRLSICLLSNGFSFSLTSVHDELLAIAEVECKVDAPMAELLTTIKGVFSELNIQPFGLKECELVVSSRQFVWVPQHLYDENRRRDYLEALCTLERGFDVVTSLNTDIKSWMIFSAESNKVSAFKIACPGLKIRCQHDKLVNAITLENSDFKSLLLVNVRDGEADYEVLCNKKLQLSNTFDCANFDEVVFHALNLTKQFHLEDAQLSIAVCGDIDRERYARIRPFFPSVTLYNGRPLMLTNPEMQHIHLYRYATIL